MYYERREVGSVRRDTVLVSPMLQEIVHDTDVKPQYRYFSITCIAIFPLDSAK